MITATIDSLEGGEVDVVDILVAYLSTNMYDEVHLVFRGMLEDMMVVANLALY